MSIKITKITTQKRSDERFNVYIDQGHGEEYGFSVDQDVLIKFHLTKGKILEKDDLPVILYEDQVKKAYNLSLHYLSYRMRSSQEIAQYLRKKEFDEEAIRVVQERLTHYGFIDDLEFAKSFVRTRSRNSTKGPGMVKQELIAKGIALALVEEALNEYPFDLQLENAMKFADKQGRQSNRKSTSELKRKVGQALQAKGFSLGVIQNALSEVEIAQNVDEEWQAIVYQGEKALRKYQKYEGFEFKNRVKQFLYRKGFSIELIERFLQENEE